MTDVLTKTVEYIYEINWEKVTKTVEVALTDDEKIKARINSLKLKVANGDATEQDKQDLELIK